MVVCQTTFGSFLGKILHTIKKISSCVSSLFSILYYNTTSLLTLRVTKYVGVFPPKQFCNTSWLSNNLTQFKHYLPGVSADPTSEGLSATRLLSPSLYTLDFLASPVCHLCLWLTGYKLEVPTTPSSGLIRLLEGLTELGILFAR